MKPGSEEWFRAESIQTMNAVYTAGDEETITHNQVIESALRRVWDEGAAQAEAARVEAEKERDQQERFKWSANERVEQQVAEILALRKLIDRAYKMMEMAGYRIAEHNQDHNNPIIAWMADARMVLKPTDDGGP